MGAITGFKNHFPEISVSATIKLREHCRRIAGRTYELEGRVECSVTVLQTETFLPGVRKETLQGTGRSQNVQDSQGPGQTAPVTQVS